MGPKQAAGTLALIGGGEWRDGCRDFDAELLTRAGDEVFVLPTAAAFEHPDRVVDRATEYFAKLGASVRAVPVLRRADAEDGAVVAGVRDAEFVYISDGSPLHLRSALKDSALFEAIVDAYAKGAVLAASGAGATVLCDPMVDPRGGAYTVGLGIVRDLAVFPYHGTAAGHLRERSIDLLPRTATLVGVDEETALIREPEGAWRVAGAGVVTLYDGRQTTVVEHGSKVERLMA
jgi:cyanophycinase